MVTKLSHTSIFVTDQDKAYDFYVNKLGFKVNTDAKMDNGFRWLTINAPGNLILRSFSFLLMKQMALMKK